MANIDALIKRAAKKYHINPRILRAQLVQESGLRNDAVSPAGARGIAQFMPATAKAYGVNPGGDPTDDVMGAAHYMADNLKRTHGDYRGALSIYNSGRPDAYKDPNFAKGQTYDYVKKIMGAAGGGRPSRSHPGDEGTPDRDITVPGTDNADLRQSLLQNYLANRGRPGSLLELGMGLRGAQDTPGSTVTVPGTRNGSQPASQGPQKHFKNASLNELFWQGAGGIDVKDGKVVPQGFVSGHTDHVHVADDQVRTLARVAKKAKQMGLSVGENPAYGGVDPVHAQNSYHYRTKRGIGEALDVSGDTKKMTQFARWVARKYGVKR